MLPIRISLIATLLTACSVRASAATEREINKETAALEKEVRALAALRDRVAAGLPATGAPGYRDGCFTLTIEGAAASGPMTVYLVRRSGDWARGMVVQPQAAPGASAGAVDLTLDKKQLSGTFDVTLRPMPHGRHYPAPGPRTYRYRVDLLTENGVRQGTAILVSARSGKKLTDPLPPPIDDIMYGTRCRCTAVWQPIRRPEFPALKVGKVKFEDDPLINVFNCEQDAVTMYEQVRAMAIVGATGLPYEVARQYMMHHTTYRGLRAAKGADTGAKKGKKPRKAPSLDELDLEGDGLLDEDPAVSSGKAKKSQGDLAFRLAQVKGVRKHVAAITGTVQEYAESERAEIKNGGPTSVSAVITDGTEPVPPAESADPEFGPWFACDALATATGKAAQLPSPAADGQQQWRYVVHWRIAGPIPFKPTQPFYPSGLPAVILAEDSPPKGGSWDEVTAEPIHGSVRLPVPKGKQPTSTCGAPPPSNQSIDASFFAYSTLNVAADCEVWTAMHVNDSARLWIDGRLAWVSGEHAWRNATDTHVFRLKLKKGTRQICVRVDNRHRPCLFGLLFCVAGSPRSTDECSAVMSKRNTAAAKVEPATDGVSGWRNDGTGAFPGAKPVTAWDQDTGVNVLWRHKKMKSSGTPVIVGDSMLVNQRPFYVECINKMTGERLWMHDCDPLSVVDPETFKKAVPLKQEALKLSGDALAAHEKKLAPFYDKEHGLKPLNLTGQGVVVDEMFPTPVTNGKRIWVLAQERVIVCLDLDGNRLWATDTGSTTGGKTCASPRLVGDLVVARLTLSKTEYAIAAWDANTGKERWRTKFTLKGGLSGSSTATPLVARVPDGDGYRDVIVAANYFAVDAKDGKVLLPDVAWSAWTYKNYATPTVHGDTIFMLRCTEWVGDDRTELAAVKLWFDGNRLGARDLWCVEVHANAYGGLITDDRYVYLPDYGLDGFGGVHVFDRLTGRRGKPCRFLFPMRSTNNWSPPARGTGGKGVLAFAESWGSAGRDHHPNHMSFVRPGSPPRVLARNTIKRHLPSQDIPIASPVFDGDRAYIRTMNGLLAVGPKDDAGRRYEAEVNARCILGTIALKPPVNGKPVEVPPLRPGRGEEIKASMEPGVMLMDWVCTGAYPSDKAEEIRKAIRFPTGPVPTTIKTGGGSRKVEAFERRYHLKTKDSVPPIGEAGVKYGDWSRMLTRVRGHRWLNGPRIDVLSATGRKPGTVSYWIARFWNRWERTVRLDLGTSGPVKAWVSGKEVSDNQRVHLKPGVHSLVLEFVFKDAPPAELMMRPCFRVSDDVATEAAQRKRQIEQDRDILERAAKFVPNTTTGRACAHLLAEL